MQSMRKQTNEMFHLSVSIQFLDGVFVKKRNIQNERMQYALQTMHYSSYAICAGTMVCAMRCSNFVQHLKMYALLNSLFRELLCTHSLCIST